VAEGEGEARHVVAEDDLVRVCAEQIGGSLAGVINDRVGAAAGLEDAVRIGVAPGEVVGHGFDHAAGDLRAAGVVEEDGRLAVIGFVQRGKLGANGVDV